MSLSKPCRFDADRCVGVVDRDAEQGDRFACDGKPRDVGRGCDKDFGEVHDAHRTGVLAVAPSGEELTNPVVVGIVAVERADQDVGI